MDSESRNSHLKRIGVEPPTSFRRHTSLSNIPKLPSHRLLLTPSPAFSLCTNLDLVHSYRELSWGQQALGFIHAGGKSEKFVGKGSVTFYASVSGAARPTTLTIKDVPVYPSHGENLLSWSALKRSAHARGQRLRLVEAEDWSLGVFASGRGLDAETQLMRFRPVGGLYVLDQVGFQERGGESKERSTKAKDAKPKEGATWSGFKLWR
jgi:hypothetical protein